MSQKIPCLCPRSRAFTRPLIAVARAAAFAAALASLAAGGVLRADILTLANGDKLKGTLVSNTGGTITFKSDILGVITVPAAKSTVKIDPPPASSTTTATARAGAAKPAPQGKRKIRLNPFPSFGDLRTVVSNAGDTTKPDDTGWFNRIDFGLASQSGRTHGLNIDLRTENDFRTLLTDTRLQNRYLYGRTSGVTSADAITSTLRFRRVLTNRLFLQSSTSYGRNTITLVQCDAQQGLGLGVNLKSTKALVLSTGADTAVRYRSFLPENAKKPADPHSLNWMIDVFQDLSLKLNERFMIKQNFLAMVAPTNDNDYKLNFNAGLTSKLTDTFAITASVELEYDRTRLPDLRYNQRITTSLGYLF